ncbi:hypothetical protein Ahia01_001294000 [Argonauta hians]
MKSTPQTLKADELYKKFFKDLSVEWTKQPSICNEPEIVEKYFKQVTQTQETELRIRDSCQQSQASHEMFRLALKNEKSIKRLLDKFHQADFGSDMNPLSAATTKRCSSNASCRSGSSNFSLCPSILVDEEPKLNLAGSSSDSDSM